MSLRRFTSVKSLRSLGRPLLKRFFDRFETQLAQSKAKLPQDSLEDDGYFNELAKLFFAPKELPRELTEVLESVIELADDRGALALTEAAKVKQLSIEWEKLSSNLDIVMQVWLVDAPLVIEKHNEHRLLATTSFLYWGSKAAGGNRLPFSSPTAATVELIRKAVDAWCTEHHRGENTTLITPHNLDGEWWFLIQHGGTMSRLAEAKGDRKTETLFYRPGKDDVVVYNIERDELRIHTGTNRERELYRQEFGLRLRGDPDHFSQRKNFDLESLRTDVGMALNPEGLEDIKRIVLQELEVSFGGEFDNRVIWKSDDIVASAARRSTDGKVIRAVPNVGRLVRAVFEVEFESSKKPRRVALRPPDQLNVARQGDLKAVQKWLSARGFRAANGE